MAFSATFGQRGPISRYFGLEMALWVRFNLLDKIIVQFMQFSSISTVVKFGLVNCPPLGHAPVENDSSPHIVEKNGNKRYNKHRYLTNQRERTS